MKRAIIGGFISLVGSILLMAFSISASSMMAATGWSTPPGKFFSAIKDANVSFGFWISVILIVLGVIIMAYEFFRKD